MRKYAFESDMFSPTFLESEDLCGCFSQQYLDKFNIWAFSLILCLNLYGIFSLHSEFYSVKSSA